MSDTKVIDGDGKIIISLVWVIFNGEGILLTNDKILITQGCGGDSSKVVKYLKVECVSHSWVIGLDVVFAIDLDYVGSVTSLPELLIEAKLGSGRVWTWDS